MGRKRNRTRKCFYLFIACMIFISFAGCVAYKKIEAEKNVRDYIIAGQKLFEQGDYEGALKEYKKVIELYKDNPCGDEGLFNTGLIYAHHGYPKKDYQKALGYFKKLVKLYPQSPLVTQAKIWIGVLKENERINRENERLKGVIEELNRVINKSKQIDIEIDEKKKELLR